MTRLFPQTMAASALERSASMRSVRAETSGLDQKPVRDSAQAAAVPIE